MQEDRTCCVIQEKLERYIQVLNSIEDNQDKFLWIMDFGKKSKELNESLKLKEFEVPGCQSQTWLVPGYHDDKLYFHADSAALISKGMVCLIADVYSGSRPQDIVDFDQNEFEKLNLKILLTPGRNNGVHGMLKKIKHYAKV
tara:strand:+ start:15 stop:440 length:426 start_codon:yes stop_codon:yes gene_type:complete